MAFGHTASRDQVLTRLFGLGEIAQHRNGFVARGLNKRAGIDDDNVGYIGCFDWAMAVREQ
jgi:hypothetical protein